MVKKLPAIQETWVRSLGQEDPLEKETATHSSILAWEFLWREGSWGQKESDRTEPLTLSLSAVSGGTPETTERTLACFLIRERRGSVAEEMGSQCVWSCRGW